MSSNVNASGGNPHHFKKSGECLAAKALMLTMTSSGLRTTTRYLTLGCKGNSGGEEWVLKPRGLCGVNESILEIISSSVEVGDSMTCLFVFVLLYIVRYKRDMIRRLHTRHPM